MDRLEQIRDLGRSLGYEELREFVTERERIERQVRFEETEDKRLADEMETQRLVLEAEREDKRLADEMETQRLVLEAEREDKRLADEMETQRLVLEAEREDKRLADDMETQRLVLEVGMPEDAMQRKTIDRMASFGTFKTYCNSVDLRNNPILDTSL